MSKKCEINGEKKVLAADKEVSENVKRAKILENYNSSNQLRMQRRLEDSQNAREFDPGTAATDEISLDMIDEVPQRVQKKRNQYGRLKNWDTIAEYYGQWGKNSTILAFPNEFADRTNKLDRQ